MKYTVRFEGKKGNVVWVEFSRKSAALIVARAVNAYLQTPVDVFTGHGKSVDITKPFWTNRS